MTRVVKNAHLYLVTGDGAVTRFGWGDLCLEQWHILRAVSADGLVLVAAEGAPGNPEGWQRVSDSGEVRLGDLIPGFVLALDSQGAVLLNHPDPEGHTLGAVSFPAIARHDTRSWIESRVSDLQAAG